jgi:hypothetical protein
MDERTRHELQAMLEAEQAKATFQGMVHSLTNKCWEVCMGMRFASDLNKTSAAVLRAGMHSGAGLKG